MTLRRPSRLVDDPSHLMPRRSRRRRCACPCPELEDGRFERVRGHGAREAARGSGGASPRDLPRASPQRGFARQALIGPRGRRSVRLAPRPTCVAGPRGRIAKARAIRVRRVFGSPRRRRRSPSPPLRHARAVPRWPDRRDEEAVVAGGRRPGSAALERVGSRNKGRFPARPGADGRSRAGPAARSQKPDGSAGCWRRRPESNRCTRICNPLRNHSATSPAGRELYGSGPGASRAGRGASSGPARARFRALRSQVRHRLAGQTGAAPRRIRSVSARATSARSAAPPGRHQTGVQFSAPSRNSRRSPGSRSGRGPQSARRARIRSS